MKNSQWTPYFEGLKEKLQLRKDIDVDLVEKAFYFAAEAHKDQKRKGGDPYIVHPVGVAELASKYNGNTENIIAALLHDTVEDTATSREEIYSLFGKKIGFLIDAVSKNYLDFLLIPLSFPTYLDKILWAGMKDIDVFFLKIMDRTHNLESLNVLKDEKQIKIAFETQAIYDPLEIILEFQKPSSFSSKKKSFEQFLSDKNIQNETNLKDSLLRFYFTGLQSGLFNLIKKEGKNIIWKISNENLYKKMVDTKSISHKISFSKVISNGKQFEAYFSHKKGLLLSTNNEKITPFYYTSIL